MSSNKMQEFERDDLSPYGKGRIHMSMSVKFCAYMTAINDTVVEIISDSFLLKIKL